MSDTSKWTCWKLTGMEIKLVKWCLSWPMWPVWKTSSIESDFIWPLFFMSSSLVKIASSDFDLGYTNTRLLETEPVLKLINCSMCPNQFDMQCLTKERSGAISLYHWWNAAFDIHWRVKVSAASWIFSAASACCCRQFSRRASGISCLCRSLKGLWNPDRENGTWRAIWF